LKIVQYLILFFFFVAKISGQSIYSKSDVEVCNSKFDFALSNNLSRLPVNEILVEIGKTFLGLNYEAQTLEKGEKEQLVIHLTGLDCYTFFESSLTFARCIKKSKTTFEDFQNELKQIRYRKGEINGYPSRLHYASDWLYDNEKRGIVKDVTKDIGGILFDKKINFMSSHSELYKSLKNNVEFIDEMKSIEDSINSREYYYIPENFVECVEDKIQTGDIILLTASAVGLDISHTGIAIEVHGRIHFMHAPLKGKKIQITEKPIGEYIRSIKRHTGFMVARVMEP
jgi:hypothetical protein